MKFRLLFWGLLLSCICLQGQKIQVGVAYAPEFDYFQGRRLAYGFDYNVRLGGFVELNPIDRVGVRGSIFPAVYGATYQSSGSPFGQGIEQFARVDFDISGELHYYFVEINNVMIKGVAGLLFPANLYERVFYFNQAIGQQNGLNFLTPEIMVGPAISLNSGRNFNTNVGVIYRRALNAFQPFSIATLEVRIGLSWVLLAKN